MTARRNNLLKVKLRVCHKFVEKNELIIIDEYIVLSIMEGITDTLEDIIMKDES